MKKDKLKREIGARLDFWFGIHPNKEQATEHLFEILSQTYKEGYEQRRKDEEEEWEEAFKK